MKKNFNFNVIGFLELLGKQIDKANPSKPRNKPYQIMGDKCKEMLKPRMFFNPYRFVECSKTGIVTSQNISYSRTARGEK